ncbi:MAG: FAD/NAD(P)-binding protein [Thermoplasmata archaeon]
MLSKDGIGESAISIASGHGNDLEFSIKAVGSVTESIMKDPKGKIGIRGPYGNSWPWKEYENIVAVTGGIGIPPIRALIEEMEAAGAGDRVSVLYGARSPSDIVYSDQIKSWTEKIDFRVTVDKGNDQWKGNVGVVTALINDLGKPAFSGAFVIGPPVMMKFAVQKLLEYGFHENNIFLSLERRMECGIGVCGHCNIGKYYTCEDGPIFRYAEIKDEPELFL